MVYPGEGNVSRPNKDNIVWLHGAGLSSRTWRADIDGIKPDLPGHGAAAPISHPTVEGFADYIEPLLPDRFALVGHSLGGMVALELAARHPHRVRALVLAEAVPTVLQSPATHFIARIAKSIMGRLSPRRLAWLSGLSEPEPVKQHLYEQIGSMTSQGIQESLDAALRYDGRPHLSKLIMPTLILIGKRNKSTHAGAKIFHHGIAGSQLIALPGGHMIHVENADQFYSAIFDFLGDKD